MKRLPGSGPGFLVFRSELTAHDLFQVDLTSLINADMQNTPIDEKSFDLKLSGYKIEMSGVDVKPVQLEKRRRCACQLERHTGQVRPKVLKCQVQRGLCGTQLIIGADTKQALRFLQINTVLQKFPKGGGSNAAADDFAIGVKRHQRELALPGNRFIIARPRFYTVGAVFLNQSGQRPQFQVKVLKDQGCRCDMPSVRYGNLTSRYGHRAEDEPKGSGFRSFGLFLGGFGGEGGEIERPIGLNNQIH